MARHPELEAMRKHWRGLRDGEEAYMQAPCAAQNKRLSFSIVFQSEPDGRQAIQMAGTAFKYYHASPTEGEDFAQFWRPIERDLLLAAIDNAQIARAPVFLVAGARNAKKASACFHMMIAPLRDTNGAVNSAICTMAATSSIRSFVDYPISEHALIATRAAIVSKAPPPRASHLAMQIAAATIAQGR